MMAHLNWYVVGRCAALLAAGYNDGRLALGAARKVRKYGANREELSEAIECVLKVAEGESSEDGDGWILDREGAAEWLLLVLEHWERER